MLKRLSILAMGSTALAFVAAPAFAQAVDADAFGQRFTELMSVSGINLTYETATTDGDTVVLSNFTIAPAGEEPVDLPGELTFTGVAAGDDGSFTAETATIADIDFTPEPEEGDPAVNITATNFLIEGITMPAEYEPGDLSGLLFYRSISMGPIAFTVEGTEVFSIESITADTDADDALTELSSTFAVTNMVADLETLASFADAEEMTADAVDAQQVIDAFGISTLTTNFSGSGTWSPETGDASLTEMRLDFADLGSLVFAADIVGYTGELYTNMMKTQQKAMSAGGELSDADSEALDAAMMEMAGQMGFASMSVTYEDDSLFMKTLEFVAAEQGVDAQTFVAGLQFMVPMMLTEVQNPQFTQMVTAAVNAFVADPQNITFSMAPAEPVYFTQLESMTDPLALIDTLGLTITANDAAAAE